MVHTDQNCNQKWIELNDALCSFERATGREYTLVLIPHCSDEEISMSRNGKPYPADMPPHFIVDMAMIPRAADAAGGSEG